MSYHQQRSKFEQELSNKAKLVASIIEENFNNYKSSLNQVAEIILIDQLYLRKDEVIQLLKFTFTNDEHIKLQQPTTALQYLNTHHKIFGKKHMRSVELVRYFVANKVDLGM